METLISYLLETIIVAAAIVPMMVIRAIGEFTPQCGLSVTLVDSTIYMLTNAVRFLWPVLQWVPFGIIWQLIEAWVTYLAFKFLMKWIPKIIHWLAVLLGKIT